MPAPLAFQMSSGCTRAATGLAGRCRGGAAGPRAAPRPATARSRRAVRVEATAVPPERPVFKLFSRGPEMTLDDIRDAYEMCSTIPAAGERAQCYSCWGLDGDRMAAYYDVVLGLESALEGGGGQQQGHPQFGGFWPAVAGAQGQGQQRQGGDNDEFRSATASMAE